MTTLREASETLTTEFIRGLREGGGCLPEADDEINDASRAVVAAMHVERGAAWLGKINHYGDDRDTMLADPDYPVLWQWEGGIVFNFQADFVLPAPDARLVAMLREYNDRSGWEPRKRSNQITAILERVRELGGASLVWT